jgi:hypothetical protein
MYTKYRLPESSNQTVFHILHTLTHMCAMKRLHNMSLFEKQIQLIIAKRVVFNGTPTLIKKKVRN